VQRLDGVVRADAVPGRGRRELGGMVGLGGIEAAVAVGAADDRLVGGDGHDVEGFRHGCAGTVRPVPR
jgi:hypothetical protein